MATTTTQQNTGTDMDALNLTHAIALVESGSNGKPNYNATGDAGTSKGAYQWQPGNFEAAAKSAGLDPNDFSPENQDKVAYSEVKAYKDKGYDPGQIASLWNSGSPNNWQNHSGTTTINGQKISYDTPAYVKKVQQHYQQIKGQTPQTPTPDVSQGTQPDPNAPDTYGATFKSSATDNPLQAGAKAVGNIPSSFFNLVGGLFNAVTHPIKTVEGIGNAFAGGVEEGWNKLTGGNTSNEATQTFDSLKKALYDRYGTLDNAARSATNDPMGVGSDILAILEGGATLADKLAGTTGVDIAQTAAEDSVKNFDETGAMTMPKVGEGKYSGMLNRGLSAVAEPVANAVKYPFGVAKNATTGLLGGLTGKGGGAVNEAFNAGTQGWNAYKTFMGALKGGADPEEIVNSTKGAYDEVVNVRNQTYKDFLSSLGDQKSSLDISPINDEINTKLFADRASGGMGIVKNADGTLDFSRSTIRFNTSAQNDINKIYDTMKTFGTQAGDRTPLGVDSLKQSFYSLDKPSSDVRAFTTAIAKKTRSVLNDVPGYTKEMADYSDMTDNIQNMRQALSLGDNAQIETTFNKILKAVKGSDPIKNQFIKELDEVTGGKLIPKIAGSMLSPVTAKGLVGHLAEIGGVGAIIGGAGFMPLIISMMTTSPKLVGALIATLGLGAGKTAQIMNYLSNLVIPANTLNRVNSGVLPNPPLSKDQLAPKLSGLFGGNATISQ